MATSKKWQLQEAKNKFSELVNKAEDEGPQYVTRRGRESVVVLSVKDYHKLRSKSTGIVSFFKSSPLHGIEPDLRRDKSEARNIPLT